MGLWLKDPRAPQLDSILKEGAIVTNNVKDNRGQPTICPLHTRPSKLLLFAIACSAAACVQGQDEASTVHAMNPEVLGETKDRCQDVVLVASQTFFDDGIDLTVGEAKFATPTKLKMPGKIKLTKGSSGLGEAFIFYEDAQTQKSVACKYRPKKAGKNWKFVACEGGPRFEGAPERTYPQKNDFFVANEVRLRVVGVDTARRNKKGRTSVTEGEVTFGNVETCNQRGFDVCDTVQVTSTRTGKGSGGERSTPIDNFDGPQTFVLPESLAVTSQKGAPGGNQVHLWFDLLGQEVARCTYTAPADEASAYAFTNCTSDGDEEIDDDLQVGSEVLADFVDLEILREDFAGPSVTVLWTDVARNSDCVPVIDSLQDDDGDGIPTELELADSSLIGDSDVDNDGIENWQDSDADGDGIEDGDEVAILGLAQTRSTLLFSATATAVPPYLENAEGCIPVTWFLDSDNDSFGDITQPLDACDQPAGYVDNGADCDDASGNIFPGASEINCNGIDEDCNDVDDGCVPHPCDCVEQEEGTVITQFQAGHGFVANSGGGSAQNLDDPTDPAFGTQSAWIETDGAGTAKTLRRVGMAPLDFSQHMPRIWVKVEGVQNLRRAQLYLGSENLLHQYKFQFDSTQGQQWTTEGDWVGFSMSWSSKHVDIQGTPDRANITDMQFRILDKADGGIVRLHVGQISMVPEPPEYPNGVLSFTFDDGPESQWTVAKPIMDAAGFAGTAYVIIERLGQNSYMTEAEVDGLHNDGWEIAYHAFAGDTHAVTFPGLPPDQLKADWVLGRQWLYDRGYTGYNHGAYPKGAITGSSTDVLGMMGDYFCGFRSIHQRHREAYGPSDPLKLRVFYITHVVAVSKVLEAIDQAVLNKEWIILVFHKLVEPATATTHYLPADFQTIVDYVGTQPIPVKTVGEILQPNGREYDADGDEALCIHDCDDTNAASYPGNAEACNDAIDNDCDPATPDIFDADGDGSSCDVDCDDANPAIFPGTNEICNDALDNDCNPATPDLFDADGDGAACDVDCDDVNPAIFPGNNEVCNDAVDNDCNPATPDLFDADQDGSSCDVDCDDTNPAIFPGGAEVCNDTLDNDCNPATLDIFDADGDGVGCDLDCEDADPGIFPGSNEICNDAIDNDCNPATPDIFDADGDGATCDLDCDDANSGNFLGNLEVCDGMDNNCDGQADEGLSCTGSSWVYWMSFRYDTTVAGFGQVKDEDIIAYDPVSGNWSMIFDGSDVGMTGREIDGMAVLPSGDILLSFIDDTSISGLVGGPDGENVDKADIVRFVPSLLGDHTQGSFSFYFDGSDVGLTTNSENIDAIALHPDGRLIVSTTGSVVANGVSGKDDDLLVFSASSIGATTVGSFEIYLDGSDIELSSGDIDAAALDPTGNVLFSTIVSFSAGGVTAEDEDVIAFSPSSLGSSTAGTFSLDLDLTTVGVVTQQDTGSLFVISLTSDDDGDGHSSYHSSTGTRDDCDDEDPNRFGGNVEVCDAIDNDCDGEVDEGLLCFAPQYLISGRYNTTLEGLGPVKDDDIIAYDSVSDSWSMVFDGSDVGLSQLEISGFAITPSGELLMSFSEPTSLSGLVGGPNGIDIDDSDMVLFTPTSTGADTAGTFSFYFDGSDVGLTTNSEKLDAIALLPDGRILISTNGSMNAGGLAASDEDIIAFTPLTLGADTAGTVAHYFDGSDVGLGSGDIDAVSVGASGSILFSTIGDFSQGGIVAGDEDIILFTPDTLGAFTSGTFSLQLDLSAIGVTPLQDTGSVHIIE